jgi:hypothetical protein
MNSQEELIELANSIEKRFKTSMIGSLSRVEDYLGFVWGHEEDMISIQQSDNRQVWQELREDILDHCNYQMRSALTDIKKLIRQEHKQNIAYKESVSLKCTQPNE